MAGSIRTRRQLTDALRWLIAAACAAAFALTFGLNYGVDNQVTYFLSALRHNDPSVLARDWYAAEATHYHPVITQLVAPLIRWWPSGWAIAILQVVVVVGGCLGWHAVCRRLINHRNSALFAYVLILGLLSATHTLSAGISYIFNEAFQPSAMGSLGLLLSVPFFVSGRWLASGVALGISGLFHANFLVLNVATFGLAHLTLGGDLRTIARRLTLQLGPSLPALAILAMPMLATAGGEHAAEARRILFEIRSPHHYTPKAFQHDFIPLAAWTMLGVASARLLYQGRALARLMRLLLALAAVVWLGTLLTSWSYNTRIAQLFVWRLAPFLDLIGQTTFCLALVRVAQRPHVLRQIEWGDWVLILVGVFAVGSAYGLRGRPLVTETLLVGVAVGVVGVGLSLTGRRFLAKRVLGWILSAAIGAGALGVLAYGTYPWLDDLKPRSSLLRNHAPHDQQLYDWVADNTNEDALFLTPPTHQSFRFDTQRAIVVDWKCTPMLPDEVVEWFSRLEDVSGKTIKTYRDLRGYEQLDPQRVERLQHAYGFDYVLTSSRARSRLKGLRQVFSNARWTVFDVRAQRDAPRD